MPLQSSTLSLSLSLFQSLSLLSSSALHENRERERERDTAKGSEGAAFPLPHCILHTHTLPMVSSAAAAATHLPFQQRWCSERGMEEGENERERERESITEASEHTLFPSCAHFYADAVAPSHPRRRLTCTRTGRRRRVRPLAGGLLLGTVVVKTPLTPFNPRVRSVCVRWGEILGRSA